MILEKVWIYGKIVGHTRFFSLGYATNLGERKLNYSASKLAMYHILFVAEELGEFKRFVCLWLDMLVFCLNVLEKAVTIKC